MSDRHIKVISFDLHETLATPDFVLAVWYEGVPHAYSTRQNLAFEAAKSAVFDQYRTVTEDQREYYDLNYWSERLKLGGYHAAIEFCKHKIAHYPEVKEVLESLSRKYPLIISSSMPREFIPPIVEGIEKYFTKIFSSFSDCLQFKTADFYRIVLKEMKIEPSEMLHVGNDWIKDYIIPCEVGINCLHLDRKSQPGYCTITDLRQLEERIERLNR